MRILLKLALLAMSMAGLGFAAAVAGAVGAYIWVAPELPSVESLRDIQFQVPLRVFSRDGRLLAEFGEKRRTPVSYEEMPARLIAAITAAEDDRFFEHPGVDYQGLARAVLSEIFTGGEKRQGGSTITMQVARNFFLTRDKTYVRKIKEIFLSLRIERELSKQQILELYLNKILLGHRAYGVGAAAEVYYGKTVNELSLAEIATIAGLPKAPSSDNPITNPERARARRAYVLRRMLELDHITRDEHDEALAAPAAATLHGPTVALDAPYVAEMVRAQMVERFGTEDAYSKGYKVTTTLDSRLQRTAVEALRSALLDYDARHGYRGPVARVTLPAEDDPVAWREALDDYTTIADLHPALVLSSDLTARIYIDVLGMAMLDTSSVAWAQRYIDDLRVDDQIPERPADVLQAGDIVYVRRDTDGRWTLSQLPDVQGAIVSVAPDDGAVIALSGGFDYYSSKFNRAVQARRQVGSAFKPFVFSAALANGFTPATLVNDAPVVFEDAALEDTWRPENYSQRFYGPTRLREALVRSRNLVSIRVLREIGVAAAIEHLRQVGFDEQ
ncbi:MAG: transglycosylase domain-containing protein, partial [Gammaproteobacteria bacterium]|nr:transglycosylase domain-containing protein [Gammaproteobacteria bacterium]